MAQLLTLNALELLALLMSTSLMVQLPTLSALLTPLLAPLTLLVLTALRLTLSALAPLAELPLMCLPQELIPHPLTALQLPLLTTLPPLMLQSLTALHPTPSARMSLV
jgi:hypothetical protein